MVTSAKSSVPTVTDQAAAMQLGQCAKNLATCLAELRTSAQKVEDSSVLSGHLGLDHRQLHHSWFSFMQRVFLSSYDRLTKPAAPWRSTLLSQRSRL